MLFRTCILGRKQTQSPITQVLPSTCNPRPPLMVSEALFLLLWLLFPPHCRQSAYRFH